MTTSELYRDHKAGKISRARFLYEVRRDDNLPWIVGMTSYGDAVKILKNKGLIREQMAVLSPDNEGQLDAIAQGAGSYESAVERLEDFGLSPLMADQIASQHYSKGGSSLGTGGSLNETYTPQGENNHYKNQDRVNYHQLMKGIDFELAKASEITDEAYQKAKMTALRNLSNNSTHYRNLVISNYDAIEKKDKDLRMKEAKPDNLVDKANGMKKVANDAPASAHKSKKDPKPSHKVKQMTQTPKTVSGVNVMKVPGTEKVVALKEALLKEFNQPRPEVEHFSVGARVKKKDNSLVGTITEFDGDTATVKTDDGQLTHIQSNVLTKHNLPDEKKKAVREDDSYGNYQKNKMPFADQPADPKHNIQKDTRGFIVQATNSDGNTFSKNDEATAVDNGEKIKIGGFIEQQSKIKAVYSVNNTPYTIDIDGLKPIKSVGVDKLRSLREKLLSAFKEDIFTKGVGSSAETVTATSDASKSALQQQGFSAVPNTGDVKSL